MSNDAGTSELEQQIRSQPEAIEHMLVLARPSASRCTSRREGLHRARRLWVVGTGTSLHAAELGAGDVHGGGPSRARSSRRCSS